METGAHAEFFTPALRRVIVVVLFVAAFGIRLSHIKDSGLTFHPSRQYRSAIIARGFYFDGLSSVPEWRRQIAALSKQRQGVWEPPVLELAAASAYRVLGEEKFWAPRLLSSVFWMLGGVFLYGLVKRLIGGDAATVSTAFYLFLPFGILASTSFQPDPLMVMGLLVSTYAIVRYYERPSWLRLMAAATVAALAIAIKFVSLFPVVAAFLVAGLYRHGVRASIFSPRCVTFVLVSSLPATSFYSYGLFINKSLVYVAQLDIMPHLLVRSSFWLDWLEQIEAVVTLPGMLAAGIGTVLVRDRLARGLLIGLWGGFVVFGLIFSYTISTHNYWNLPVVPIVAIASGALAAAILREVANVWRSLPSRVFATAIAISLVVLSANRARLPLAMDNSTTFREPAARVGAAIGHSTRAVFLAPQYGKPLEYYGDVSGSPWPRATINRRWARRDEPVRTVQQRLDALGFAPEYFVIMSLEEFRRHHSDLRQYLEGNCALVSDSPEYLVYAGCTPPAAVRADTASRLD